MKERPTSVTVISWILIVMGALSLVTGTLGMLMPETKEIMKKSPIPFNVQIIMMYASLTISIVCGAAMLKGKNWARYFYVISSAIGIIIGFLTSPMKGLMVPSLIFIIVIAIFLFRADANEYFKEAKE